MRFWIRELAGWLLIGVGLFMAYLVYLLCLSHRLTEVWAFAVFGIFVFRGGIHLLKVAIAARVCLQAQDRLYPASELRPRPPAPPRLPRRGE
jgi:hypothetical protein